MKAIVTLALAFGMLFVANVYYYGDMKTVDCYVIENDGYMTVLEDEDGNLWDVIDNSYERDEFYAVTFRKNHTTSILDDEVIKAEKLIFEEEEITCSVMKKS